MSSDGSMGGLKFLINANLDKHKYFDDLFIPIGLLDAKTSTPGIKLDCCKSILEGVLKTMLSRLNLSLSAAQLSKLNSKDAALKLFKVVALQNDDFDADFVNNVIITVQDLSNARNQKGDISHGHVSPKQNASEEFAQMIIQHTEAICVYLLKHFYLLDLSYQQPEAYDSQEKADFNAYLDDIGKPIGQVAYSNALYQLDYDSYIDEYDRYIEG